MRDPNRRTGLSADVHRFRDHVAVHVGTGETTYLTPKQARKLARALYVATRDVETHSYQDSRFDQRHIDIN